MRRAAATVIHQAIVSARGRRVILDADIAALYGVPTKALIQAVRRNGPRFPADFMFRLTRAEVRHLRSQIVTSSGAGGWGGRRNTPYAFTEQGVAMLSSVLRSRRAIEANIAIMRAFVRLHEALASSESLKRRLDELQKKYDSNFRVVFDAIRELMSPPTGPSIEIGFRPVPNRADAPSEEGGTATLRRRRRAGRSQAPPR